MERNSDYDDFLREIFGETVKIGSYDYDVAEAIYSIDPVAYRIGMLEWEDGEANE